MSRRKRLRARDALHQAAFEVIPFTGRDDAGNEVEGENPFHALGIAIDVEGDALAEKGQIDGMAFVVELLPFEGFKQGVKVAVMGANRARRIHHFVEEIVVAVFSQHELESVVLRTLYKFTPPTEDSCLRAMRWQIQRNPTALGACATIGWQGNTTSQPVKQSPCRGGEFNDKCSAVVQIKLTSGGGAA